MRIAYDERQTLCCVACTVLCVRIAQCRLHWKWITCRWDWHCC